MPSPLWSYLDFSQRASVLLTAGSGLGGFIPTGLRGINAHLLCLLMLPLQLSGTPWFNPTEGGYPARCLEIAPLLHVPLIAVLSWC